MRPPRLQPPRQSLKQHIHYRNSLTALARCRKLPLSGAATHNDAALDYLILYAGSVRIFGIAERTTVVLTIDDASAESEDWVQKIPGGKARRSNV
eukprot:6177097-Pleurochrysis_carterae.AAC.3